MRRDESNQFATNRRHAASAALWRDKPLGVLLTIFLVALVAGGCSQKDKVVMIEDDDPEMLAAIEKARASLPQFWEALGRRSPDESVFSLKVKITDKRGSEHFWLTDIERSDGRISGTINNDPNIVRSVKPGDRIPIPEADISDWLYKRGDKMVGNFTLRILFKQMRPDEVARYKAIMADP